MADTAIQNEEEKREYFDSPAVLDAKVTQLAQWVRECNHMTAFTGAGVSTSTGIPDYRSGYQTVLETGPGQWELEAYKLKYKQEMLRNGKPLPAAQTRSFHIAEARASLTHMALVELQSRGILKGVVSQNVDGLHRKTGIIPENMAEVHGNINLEYCSRCNKEHMRDYRTRTAKTVHDHKTGRICDSCGGDLVDSIINFGDNLNAEVLARGERLHAQADLAVCMGSSMRIQPACHMPLKCKQNGGKIVVINLQKTGIDA